MSDTTGAGIISCSSHPQKATMHYLQGCWNYLDVYLDWKTAFCCSDKRYLLCEIGSDVLSNSLETEETTCHESTETPVFAFNVLPPTMNPFGGSEIKLGYRLSMR